MGNFFGWSEGKGCPMDPGGSPRMDYEEEEPVQTPIDERWEKYPEDTWVDE